MANKQKSTAGKRSATGTGRKPRAGRRAAAGAQKPGAGPKLSAADKKLIAEIEALLPGLDRQGLEFIKRQAEVLLATEELARSREQTIKAIEKVSTKEPARLDRPVEPSPPAVAIERKQENAFFIRTYGKKVFFNRHEMRELARLAHGADNPADGARRLHAWLKRERNDYLIDTGMTGPGDPALRIVWEQIVSTYAPPRIR